MEILPRKYVSKQAKQAEYSTSHVLVNIGFRRATSCLIVAPLSRCLPPFDICRTWFHSGEHGMREGNELGERYTMKLAANPSKPS